MALRARKLSGAFEKRATGLTFLVYSSLRVVSLGKTIYFHGVQSMSFKCQLVEQPKTMSRLKIENY